MEKFSRSFSNLPNHIRFLFAAYLAGMTGFSLFRAIFLFSEHSQAKGMSPGILLHAWLMGWRFDSVVSGYILLLPFLLSASGHLWRKIPQWNKRIVFSLLALFYVSAFALCAIDIPYYRIANTRLTSAVTTWFGSVSIALQTIFKTPRYLLFLLLFFFLSALFIWVLLHCYRSWVRRDRESLSTSRPILRCLGFLLALLLIIVGIRGRVTFKSPIRWGTAFFCNHSLANQAGLNPVFTFAVSYLETRRSTPFLETERAQALVRNYYRTGPSVASPVFRPMTGNATAAKINIVLIIMESMQEELMGHGSLRSPTLTPFLDSLLPKTIFFNRYFSGGIHTFNAIWEIFSGLPSFPAADSPLKNPESMIPYPGMAVTLSRLGYRTLFCCPHDEQFDNLGGFLRINGFQTIVSAKNFPQVPLTRPWNIPDHQFFDLILPNLREIGRSGIPFLFTVLTVSNHPPYTLPRPFPPQFVPRSRERWAQAVEYADWSIGRFIGSLQNEPWFDRTLFVLVGDHGLNIAPRFEINPRAHHVPLLLYAPRLIPAPGIVSVPGSHIDLFPTLMHMLGLPYENDTFGSDLFFSPRPYLVLCTDSRLGVMDGSFLLIAGKSSRDRLYDLSLEASEDILDLDRRHGEKMKEYAFAILQTARQKMKNRR